MVYRAAPTACRTYAALCTLFNGVLWRAFVSTVCQCVTLAAVVACGTGDRDTYLVFRRNSAGSSARA